MVAMIMKTAVMVSTSDFGTPVDCCIPIAPDFKTARKNAINGVETMLFFTIRAASIPLLPSPVAKLFRKYP